MLLLLAPASLTWPLRMKIALGAAQGLAYLHEDTEERFIFRDFKTSNVLLDKVSVRQLSVTACHSGAAGQGRGGLIEVSAGFHAGSVSQPAGHSMKHTSSQPQCQFCVAHLLSSAQALILILV